MEHYINDKGEQVIIKMMDNNRLIHAIAKYARKVGVDEELGNDTAETEALVKALKIEALERLSDKKEESEN